MVELFRSFGNCGQLIVVSHNYEIVRKFDKENVHVFSRTSHLEPTEISLLSNIAIHGDLEDALIRGDVI